MAQINTNKIEDSYFWLTWNESSQSIANNKTTISWSCGLMPAHSYYTNAIKMGPIVINGVTVYSGGTYSNITDYKSHTFASGSLDIYHNADGTKTFTVDSFWGWLYNTGTATSTAQSFSLTTIPRASSFSVSGKTLGSPVSFSISRASSSFTHDISYILSGGSWVSIASGVGASYKWSGPALSLASNNINGESIAVIYRVVTKRDSTVIGEKKITSSWAIPDSVKPSISFTTSDPTGYLSRFGAYVQGRSKVKVDLSASGIYGSTISTRYINIGGFCTSNGSSVTSDAIPNTSVSISCSVTDSRGRSNSSSGTITVKPYNRPRISTISAVRCDASGTQSKTGSYGKVVFSAAITSLKNGSTEKNIASYEVQYRESGSGEAGWVSAGTYAKNNLAPSNISSDVFACSKNTRYECRVVAKDYFNDPVYSSLADISPTFVLQHLAKSMLSVGIGRLCNKANALQIGLKTYFDNTVDVAGGLNVTGEIQAIERIYMGGAKKTDDEKQIYFQSTTNADNVHSACIYGGNGSSTAAIGIYDSKNSRSVLRYADGANTITFTPKAHFDGGLTEDIQFLTSGNCDTLITSGQYYIGSRGTNKPGTQNGWLTVKALNAGAYCSQEYITYTGLRYRRMRDNGTWGSWIQEADFVVQQGTSGIWTYRKWNSGLAEYWGKEQNFTLEDGWHRSPAAPFTIVSEGSAVATVTNWYGNGDNPNRAALPNIITVGGLYSDGSISVYNRNYDGTIGTGYRAYYYDVKARWK